ncbi:MAG: M23 family metallopeptidase [Deltaproteobacteria bacterium]|nr:M23 family metallopeptidase [Deltaproteobacteria bacterium]
MSLALLLTALLLAALPAPVRAGLEEVDVSAPEEARQGELVLVSVSNGGPLLRVAGRFHGQRVRCFRERGSYACLVGIDLALEPRDYPLELTLVGIDGETEEVGLALRVVPRSYEVQRLTLPPQMVELDEATLERVVAEQQRVSSVWEQSVEGRLWQGAFMVPAVGEVTGRFGLRRILNGIPRAPHSGVDIAAPVGTKVVAANTGRVLLVDNFYFNGRSVFIDHGLGLFTMYFHLDKALVTEGQHVRRGDWIGTVGNTGRATGPHLHWGARLYDARLDPFSLLRAFGR